MSRDGESRMGRTTKNGIPNVELQRDVECMRCGAPTHGRATCELCFEAITELRSLTEDFHAPKKKPVPHAPRSLARQGSNGNSRRHRS
jgi:hypothetical protein